MVISGLVLTLSEDANAFASQVACGAVESGMGIHGQLTAGVPQGHRLPLVVEAIDEAESERVFQQLRDLPGVQAADVVYVQFE